MAVPGPLTIPDLNNMKAIAQAAADAEVEASFIISSAHIAASDLRSNTDVTIALDQANVDISADGLRVGGQAYAAQVAATTRTAVASIEVLAREGASLQVNQAQTAAAVSINTAQVNASFQLAASRIAAQTTTTTADVAAVQTVSDARIAALLVTTSADVAAAQTTSAAQIAGLQVDWATRLATAQILITAREAAAQVQANAQVDYEQHVSIAEIEANQTEASARLAAAVAVAAANILATFTTTTAQVAAATVRADAEIQVAVTAKIAGIAAATTETQAQITVVNLDPSNYVVDLELQGVKYAATQALIAREFGATASFNAGVVAADLQLQGVVYASGQRLVGVKYTSDKDTVTTEAVAVIRADSSEYAATRQLQGVEFAATAAFNRFLAKVAFAQARFDQIWPLISGTLSGSPDTIQTPGYSANVPAIGALDVITPTDAAVLAAGAVASLSAKAAGEASRLSASLQNQGYASTSGLNALSDLLILDGVAESLNATSQFELHLAELNSKQLLSAQQARADQFEALNRVALGAEANLVARQVGLVAAMPQLISVRGG